ncbi:MAG: DUF6249 domain-containing protein [bacterium]
MVPSPGDILTLSVIPLVALIGTFTLVVVIVLVVEFGRRTRNRMIHEERMAAIEKGLPVPPPFIEGFRRPNYVMRGLVLIALGLAFGVWTLTDPDFPLGIGAILFFIGLAILIAHFLTESRRKESYPSEIEHRSGPGNPS